jgi:hypothetical protein
LHATLQTLQWSGQFVHFFFCWSQAFPSSHFSTQVPTGSAVKHNPSLHEVQSSGFGPTQVAHDSWQFLHLLSYVSLNYPGGQSFLHVPSACKNVPSGHLVHLYPTIQSLHSGGHFSHLPVTTFPKYPSGHTVTHSPSCKNLPFSQEVQHVGFPHVQVRHAGSQGSHFPVS